jgi:hypothetical protein
MNEASAIVTNKPDDAASSHPYGGCRPVVVVIVGRSPHAIVGVM